MRILRVIQNVLFIIAGLGFMVIALTSNLELPTWFWLLAILLVVWSGWDLSREYSRGKAGRA